MRNALILHGTEGSSNGNWFQSLKSYLESKGITTTVPALPTPIGQSLKNWLSTIKPLSINTDTILCGHSCGAVFALHILERLNAPVRKSIFVSGFLSALGNSHFDKLNKTFIDYNFDWKKIKQNAGEIHILHGDNDPYVPIAQAQKLANNLGSELIIIKNGGHLNAEFGFTEVFPELLNAVK